MLSRGHSVMPLRTIRCLTDVKTPGEDEEHPREPSATFDDIMGFGRLDSPCKVRASKRQPNSWARTARPTPILLTADRHIEHVSQTGDETQAYVCAIGNAALIRRADTIETRSPIVQSTLHAWAQGSVSNLPIAPAGYEGPGDHHALMIRDGRGRRAIGDDRDGQSS